MGFWNKLGKIALTVAPYVAAPFTGGASLAATGLANKAVQKWSESDAKKAAQKGLGPSSFDKYLGLAGDVAGGLSSVGALGKFGSGKYGSSGNTSYVNDSVKNVAKSGSNSGWQSQLSNILGGGYPGQPGYAGGTFGGGGGFGGFGGGTPGIVSTQKPGSWQDMLSGILDKYGQSQHNPQPTQDDYTRGGGYGGGGGQDRGRSRFGRQMRRELGPIMGQTDQNFPNLAESIGAGRMEAIRNQPWRGGYDINTVGPNDEEGNPTTITSNMPPVYPTGRRRGSRFTYASQ